MQSTRYKMPWESHDWKVKTAEEGLPLRLRMTLETEKARVPATDNRGFEYLRLRQGVCAVSSPWCKCLR